MFRFASPWFLILLALIPAALYLRARKRTAPAMGLPDLRTVAQIPASAALAFQWILPFLKYAALCLLILALARPQWGTKKMNVLTEGINIILAVDLSESMAALDFRLKGKIVNRLEAVKDVVQKFIDKRDGDRIGLVVFGSQAYTQAPMTRDYAAIASILEKLQIGAAGKSTAIGDAIGISVKRLADIESKSNIIILLTDGESNSGELSPMNAADIAAQKDVKIYTIGAGSRGEALFLVNDPVFGERYVPQRVSMDEDTLRAIAQKTGGLYFRAEDLASLENIYDTIDKLEKTEVEVKAYAEYREYYLYLLVPAFFLLTLWIILSNTRYLKTP